MKEVTTNIKNASLKTVLAWCLAICMIVSVVPVTALASEAASTDATVVATDANATDANATDANAVYKVVIEKSSYKYTGKAIKPAVKVQDKATKKNKSSKYYKVSYKNNVKIGKATITVKFVKGKFKGQTIKKTFKIVPSSTKITKITAAKKSFKITWKKHTKNTTGFQVRYSTSKKFTAKKTKTVTVKGNKKTATTIKKLKANKKYYVQVRTYKTVKGKKYVSSWSKVKTVKTK